MRKLNLGHILTLSSMFLTMILGVGMFASKALATVCFLPDEAMCVEGKIDRDLFGCKGSGCDEGGGTGGGEDQDTCSDGSDCYMSPQSANGAVMANSERYSGYHLEGTHCWCLEEANPGTCNTNNYCYNNESSARKSLPYAQSMHGVTLDVVHEGNCWCLKAAPSCSNGCYKTEQEAQNARGADKDSYYQDGSCYCLKSSCPANEYALAGGYYNPYEYADGHSCPQCTDPNSIYNGYTAFYTGKCTCTYNDSTTVPEGMYLDKANCKIMKYCTGDAITLEQQDNNKCYMSAPGGSGKTKCYKEISKPDCSANQHVFRDTKGFCSCTCNEGYTWGSGGCVPIGCLIPNTVKESECGEGYVFTENPDSSYTFNGKKIACGTCECLLEDTKPIGRGYSYQSCKRDGKTYYGNYQCQFTKKNINGKFVKDEEGNYIDEPLMTTIEDGEGTKVVQVGFETPVVNNIVPETYEETDQKYCYNCSDESDKYRPCQGMQHCRGEGRWPKGEVKCHCGLEGSGYDYYDGCLTAETCVKSYSDTIVNGVAHHERLTTETGGTMAEYYASYRVKEKCSQTDGTKVYYWADCNHTGVDMNGNTAPAAGLQRCEKSDNVIGPVDGAVSIHCGSFDWYQKDDCQYETCTVDYTSPTINGVKYYQYKDAEYFKDKTENGSTYRVKEKCAQADGTKVYYWADCNHTGTDMNGNTAPAAGLQKCEKSDNVIGPVDGAVSIHCGSFDWYQKDDCQIEECMKSYSNTIVNGVAHHEELTTETGGNMAEYWESYRVKEKCSRTDGTKVYYWADCNHTGIDMNGNTAPAAGLKRCGGANPVGVGRTVHCGSFDWYESCAKECPGTQHESDCSPNQIFKPMCTLNNSSGIEVWGECEDKPEEGE